MKLREMIPAPYNPRRELTPDDTEYIKIKRSIEAFGYVDPIIVNTRTGYIVGGNQRHKVMLDLGIDEETVVIVDLSEDEEKALNVALNKINGEWDYERLDELLAELDNSGFDISLTGFDEDELDEMLADEHEADNIYTDVINIPQYPITDKEISLEDCLKQDKASELLLAIEQAADSISEQERLFLQSAAYRHNVFHYGNIAEYYAQASPAMQRLMEQSALVIIDYNDAIRNGYVRLRHEIEAMMEEDIAK